MRCLVWLGTHYHPWESTGIELKEQEEIEVASSLFFLSSFPLSKAQKCIQTLPFTSQWGKDPQKTLVHLGKFRQDQHSAAAEPEDCPGGAAALPKASHGFSLAGTREERHPKGQAPAAGAVPSQTGKLCCRMPSLGGVWLLQCHEAV